MNVSQRENSDKIFDSESDPQKSESPDFEVSSSSFPPNKAVKIETSNYGSRISLKNRRPFNSDQSSGSTMDSFEDNCMRDSDDYREEEFVEDGIHSGIQIDRIEQETELRASTNIRNSGSFRRSQRASGNAKMRSSNQFIDTPTHFDNSRQAANPSIDIQAQLVSVLAQLSGNIATNNMLLMDVKQLLQNNLQTQNCGSSSRQNIGNQFGENDKSQHFISPAIARGSSPNYRAQVDESYQSSDAVHQQYINRRPAIAAQNSMPRTQNNCSRQGGSSYAGTTAHFSSNAHLPLDFPEVREFEVVSDSDPHMNTPFQNSYEDSPGSSQSSAHQDFRQSPGPSLWETFPNLKKVDIDSYSFKREELAAIAQYNPKYLHRGNKKLNFKGSIFMRYLELVFTEAELSENATLSEGRGKKKLDQTRVQWCKRVFLEYVSPDPGERYAEMWSKLVNAVNTGLAYKYQRRMKKEHDVMSGSEPSTAKLAKVS